MDNNKSLSEFLQGKSAMSIELFDHFVSCYQQLGDVKFHATKTMIAFSSRINFAYIIQFGKNFIDVVFPFKQPYEDNLCFRKIKPVPGSDDYNHHIRIYYKEDINDEVLKYMYMAYENGNVKLC
ncbi:hypothetical protein CPT03_00205 [Pedobacter ginsengisoli]|uniref:DUF5655 domain-containing protein n=1 Tax=Pedobacter ginsengisoli TaxID=363852 RepID=A0A2D1U083_9SPHI|nr:DUF5655 domain-containing protein [Pedobacter ginsengisoli]ATP55000.1 hypothetical protein CPT03_00205 [Pedobacter ginsengisoli]